jgi:tRNA modification GTPase
MLPGTIAAIATPLGEGGIAIIRISGPDAIHMADQIFRPAGSNHRRLSSALSHTVHYGHIVHDSQLVDEVLVTVLRAPRTFTREDTVEISCHGGVLISRQVLNATLAAGARLAEPGEFTQRAFIHGRIDLAQAEAVADLIHSRTELAARVAQDQLAGKLSRRIQILRDDLMRTLAHIEAHIDFPDEDISPDTRNTLTQRIEAGLQFIEELLQTAREGQILRRGIRAAIIGRPNVGKSSLLNQLLGHDRAIVSPVAGTTRDTIEETANVRGIPVVFIDTAGLRNAGDEVEEQGIQRTHAALDRAELILHVLDASAPLTSEDIDLLRQLKERPHIVVLNKSDLPRALDLCDSLEDPSSMVELSCANGTGLETLKDAIQKRVWKGVNTPENIEVTINARHQEVLRRAREATRNTLQALRTDLPLELVAIDLRIAADAVGEVVGKTTTEDLLDSIFSQFCLGK